MWDEITHPFANFNYASVGVLEWISNLIKHSTDHYLSILGFKLIHVGAL